MSGFKTLLGQRTYNKNNKHIYVICGKWNNWQQKTPAWMRFVCRQEHLRDPPSLTHRDWEGYGTCLVISRIKPFQDVLVPPEEEHKFMPSYTNILDFWRLLKQKIYIWYSYCSVKVRITDWCRRCGTIHSACRSAKHLWHRDVLLHVINHGNDT